MVCASLQVALYGVCYEVSFIILSMLHKLTRITCLQTFPFFGVVPAIVDEQGKELQGPCEGFLVSIEPTEITLHANAHHQCIASFKQIKELGRPAHNSHDCCAAREAAVHISYTGKISIRLTASVCNNTTMPRALATIMLCDTCVHNGTFCTSFFSHERSLLFVIVLFLEIVFLGSLQRNLSAKAQQSLYIVVL